MTVEISKISRFESPYDVPGYLLRLMGLIWHRRLNAELAKIDLTEMQFVLMIGLGWIEDSLSAGVTQKELANNCGASTALTSQVLQNLAKKGFVKIVNHNKDGRARVVTLTSEGQKKLRSAVRILDRVDEEFWSDNPKVASKLHAALRDAIKVKVENSDDPERDFGAMALAQTRKFR